MRARWFMLGVVVLALLLWAPPRPPAVLAQIPTGYPTWTCSVDNVAGSAVQCQPAPSPDQRLYLTDLVGNSTTATGGQLLLQYGTGSNCGTGTKSLLPSSIGAVRIGYPGNTAASMVMAFHTPLIVPAGNALCVVAIATNTFSGQLSGLVGP